MPITLKSPRQIELLRASGQLVRETFELLRDHVRPGVTTAELDAIAEEFIRSRGAEPVYKGYVPPSRRGWSKIPPFPGSICVSINDVICHGIPSKKDRLRQGDIIGIDIGLRLNGWIGDACETFAVGEVDDQTQHLLTTARNCLELGIAQAHAGKTLGDIGAAIQHHAETNGFSVVREYTGHGLGRNLHEEPTILHYGEPGTGRKLIAGMVFTIEPMINAGKADTRLERDGWTVRTADGKRSAQFEHTLAISQDGPILLTG
ncbi:type I methionyl aminopeptidase [Candidatus Viridilinea mediisalina]|uniref:Methionine aminopeptidase n=1 Tax=Candidatus Viridilinea mediisalina TaxID=2024553 RepID=A0A2A6RKP5_9CHLR|nr:type I methionyl aminopeptidase [Candidatus Viridilinea mediisalina]PDW03647.1 type I methionyl aminopeptidase [Candidatus Viridilinea mediisalina]